MRPLPAAIEDSSSSSGSDSTLTQRMPSSTASASSRAVLPTPENMILSGGMPAARARFSSPSETTSAPAPSFASVRDHRLVGIRLHGVADERRHVGEGVGEDPVVALERRGRIAIERRADRRPRARRDRPPRRAARRPDSRSGASERSALAQSMSQSRMNALSSGRRRDCGRPSRPRRLPCRRVADAWRDRAGPARSRLLAPARRTAAGRARPCGRRPTRPSAATSAPTAASRPNAGRNIDHSPPLLNEPAP